MKSSRTTPVGLRMGMTRPIETQLAEGRVRFLRYIRSRIADPELAEDILQDSLLKALQGAAELRDEERLLPWFYQIMRNAIVDAYRRRAAAAARVAPLERDGRMLEAAAPAEHDTVVCECFRAMLPTLKPEYAEVIQALDLGTETPEALAERLDITPVNLKVRRHRARRALRRRLEETCRVCAEHHCLDCICRQVPAS